jgi:hypothetical protein
MKRWLSAVFSFNMTSDQEAAWGWKFWAGALVSHFLVNELGHVFESSGSAIGNVFPQVYFLLVFGLYCTNRTKRRAAGLYGRRAVMGLVIAGVVCAFLFGILMAAEFLAGLVVRASAHPWRIGRVDAVVVLVAAPIVEELFFRAALIPALLRDFKRGWAVIVYAALIFMLAHFSFYGGALLLGVIAGYLFVKTRSPYPGMVFHVLCNAVALFSVAVLPNLTQLCLELRIFRMFLR